MAHALFTGTQQRVLSVLFGQPDRAFVQQEVIELARSGSGAVRRELDRLVESELVTRTIVGRQKLYQANRSSPIFREVQSIVTKTVGVVDPLRAALKPLGRRVRLAIIFGSVAKRTDRATSDIDVLLVADDVTLEELFKRFRGLEKKLGRVIQPTLYTTAEFARRKNAPFLKEVLRGEHILVMGNADDVEPR